MVPLVGSIPFGFGFVLVYISTQNYLVDAYTIYAASVLAANTLMRSTLGAAFPLFTHVLSTRFLLSILFADDHCIAHV